MSTLHGAPGASSSMAEAAGGSGVHHTQGASAMSQQQRAYEAATRSTQPPQPNQPYNGRIWSGDPHGGPIAAAGPSTSISSSSPSPRYGNSERSASNMAAESNATSLLSSSSTMPTTAASLMREGPRDFTVIKDVGDGSFGTVCLADWRSPLPSGTLLSPMQHPTTRPEYLGKRLVAIKKMKKPFPSWEECMKLKELKVSRPGRRSSKKACCCC